MNQQPSHINVPPLSPNVESNPKYIPDPVLQKYDSLPQPYRMINRIVEDIFSKSFDEIDKLDKDLNRNGTSSNNYQDEKSTLSSPKLSNSNSNDRSRKIQVIKNRNTQTKIQNPILSHEIFGIEDATCVGTSKAPVLQEDGAQVSTRQVWLLISKSSKNIYFLRRDKVVWNYKDFFYSLSNTMQNNFKEEDLIDIRCLAKQISVLGSVSSDGTKIHFWIYVEREGLGAPEFNHLATIQNNSKSTVENIYLSNDARYAVIEYKSEEETTIRTYKLPSYKKFAGEQISSTRPKSSVSVTSTSQKGGRRVLASNTGSTSNQKKNEPSFKPQLQVDRWDIGQFNEAKDIFHISKQEYLDSIVLTSEQRETLERDIFKPQVCFISNYKLLKQASTTNSVYRLYDENFVRLCQTRSIAIFWENAPILKVFEVEQYYIETRELPKSRCKSYTFASGITCISKNEEEDKFAVGLRNGNIIVFDSNSHSSTYIQSAQSPISAISFTTFGCIIVGCQDGEIRIFAQNNQSESHSPSYSLMTNILFYKEEENLHPILAFIPAKDSNLFWCCTSKYIDILDTNGNLLCSISLQNLLCFKYLGSFENILVVSSHCVVNESHGFFIFEMLDAIVLAYPEIEQHFPSIQNSESAVGEVFLFVNSTSHTERNNPVTINNFLMTPSFMKHPFQQRATSTRFIGDLKKSSQGSSRPKSKGVSFGTVKEEYIPLNSIGKNQALPSNPIQRATLRIKQSQIARKQRIRDLSSGISKS